MTGPTDKQLEYVARKMRKRAMRGVFTGRESEVYGAYFRLCYRQIYGTVLFFTRDADHHLSGWMRNPDYERCWHLSTSPAPKVIWTPDTPDLDHSLRDRWLRAFFGENLRYVWAESPKLKQGKALGVWHWRLFADENWDPILPRKEVYSSEFTEIGWKTASEVGVEIVSALDPT